ncbi:hypothetical protein SAMN05660909_00162 [Chitinophaga terrae (ex Kim and Jung 2007)]|jgi:hypothetical protein|uniref:Uncharacterized protein n=1 Tax=Chitinophaga terrae (ex Kim and Jung 2007) TaxID=408074 RepID=A0A1H3X156_9BACT|nr:hypothetical protein [Chitinophaga terrae (ex Kim and Jung 2007)]GEP90230.1 hypothetical protein CTE07_18750 [Chitinophaga terrae (ex Kim and Jung 2007)]SDZ92248.1 hypothetical protein SAMN05660909_00162 [Chitinophaga terrae (ex Kim and Jung 2007)]
MLKKLSLSCLFVFSVACTFAQSSKKPAKAAPSPATSANKRPAKLRSSWSIFLSDTLPKNEVIKLLDSALIVRDEKNVKYPVISFAFTYEKHEPYLNDTTGQVNIYKDYTGDNFKAATLSPLWSKALKANLESGDVLYFDEIIIQYTPDKMYKAPSLRFDVK